MQRAAIVRLINQCCFPPPVHGQPVFQPRSLTRLHLCLADEKDAIARLAKVASSVTQAADVEPAARARAEIEASLKALESKVRNRFWVRLVEP